MLISRQLAKNALLTILALVTLFHILALLTIIPHTVVWAGKFNSYKEVLPFEIFSLVINLSFILLVSYRVRNDASKAGRIGMWMMFVLFALNTVGNFFAETDVEMYTGTPLTFLLAVLSLRLALKDKPEQNPA